MGIFKPEPTKEEVAAKKKLKALVAANNNEQARKEKLAKETKELEGFIKYLHDEKDAAINNRNKAIISQKEEEVKLKEAQNKTRKENEKLSAVEADVTSAEKHLTSVENQTDKKAKELEGLVTSIEVMKSDALKEIATVLEKAKGLF